MKKIITLFISGVLTISAFSQTNFFLEAGINSSVPAFEGRLLGNSAKEARTGFTASAGIINKLGHGFQLTNRLSFITKNFHESYFVGPDNSGTNDYTLSGLQYHLLLEKDFMPKKKFHVFPVAGAYTTLHTGGEIDYAFYGIAGLTKGSREPRFEENGDFSRWDAGLTAGGRFQFKKFSLGILYDIGLVKIDPHVKAKWSSVHFTLAYFFK